MTTVLTEEIREKLRVDVEYIDDQLDQAKRALDRGDRGEAASLIDSLLGLYDFKKHFPDVPVNAERSVRFIDLYNLAYFIDECALLSILAAMDPPGDPPVQEVLDRLARLIRTLTRWKNKPWAFAGAKRLINDLLQHARHLQALLRALRNANNEPEETRQRRKRILTETYYELVDSKRQWLRYLSGPLPLWELYLRFRKLDKKLRELAIAAITGLSAHLAPDWSVVTPTAVLKRKILAVEFIKHEILAIIDGATSIDGPPPKPGSGPPERPPGWDDLLEWPPPGYALRSNGYHLIGKSSSKKSPKKKKS